MGRFRALLLALALGGALAAAPARSAETLGLPKLEVYRSNYILPYAYNFNPDPGALGGEGVDNAEFKFQLSLRHPLDEHILGDRRFGAYLSYTQLSFWQFYNVDASSPFRETNYEPELFLVYRHPGEPGALRLYEVRAGFDHQSNGRGGEESRSWNRLYAEAILDAGTFRVSLRPWWRIPEGSGSDDNPDIDRYLGYGELRALAAMGESAQVSLLVRNNLRADNRGAVELGLSFAVNESVRFYVQYFEGYGESLADYDRPVTRIGAGISVAHCL